MLIDYAGCSITVFRDGATARAAFASGSHQIALHLVHGLPVVDARFDDLNPTRLLLDTASDGEVDVNREYASTSIATFTSAGAAARRWSPGGWISGERVRTRSLSLGDVTFDRPRVSIFSSLPPAGLGVVGHIGNGLLDRFALLLDEPDSIAVLATEPAR